MYVGAFGPITWDVLLLCALHYPAQPTEHQRLAMLSFLAGLMYVLPCDGCGAHAIRYIQQHPPDVSSSDALVGYVVTFHNVVNLETDKRVYTVEEAKKALFVRYLADGEEMTRTQRMRKEDHAKINELQSQLSSLRNKDRANIVELQAQLTSLRKEEQVKLNGLQSQLASLRQQQRNMYRYYSRIALVMVLAYWCW